MKKKTKQDLILIHLQMYGKITAWEAIGKFRATRLSAIIYNLKKEGHLISTINKRDKSSGANYSEYILHQENGEGQINLI